VLYGILDLKTREFSYARAGHEPPLILHADGSVERMPHSPGMALGLWDEITLDERPFNCCPVILSFIYRWHDRLPRSQRGGVWVGAYQKNLSELQNSATDLCDTLLETA
jgi:serine phosphatase RsbU (regulator of sigma subunit)